MSGRENKGRRRPKPPGRLQPTPGNPLRAVEAHADVAVLVHELASLLDGSMRWLTLALKSIDRARGQHADESLDNAYRQLETAGSALERMADLVAAAMHGATVSIGSVLHSGGQIGLAECVRHAADVLGPETQELGIVLTVEIAEDLRALPAGPLYSAVLNGLRNAVDSIRSCDAAQAAVAGGVPGGMIQVVAARLKAEQADPAAEPWVVLTITDDGKGPPPLAAGASVFDHGFSTKPGGSGLGLSVARSVVREMQGTIELTSRSDTRNFRRPGAVLRIAFPPSGARAAELGNTG